MNCSGILQIGITQKKRKMEKEPRPISDLVNREAQRMQMPARSGEQELKTFDDIELTPEEVEEGLRLARERKAGRLEDEARQVRREELRRQLTEQWTYERTLDFMLGRIEWVGQRENRKIAFIDKMEGDRIVANADSIFRLLCFYFSRDPQFTVMANEMGVPRPELRKGLYLAGPIGCGKTTLMRIMQVNQRQVFMIKNAAELSREWRMADKDQAAYFEKYCTPYPLPAGDTQSFYQRQAGLCIDDLGTEEIAMSYGNRSNVLADLIETRYQYGAMGDMFHVTTNLPADKIKEFYGDRVASRLRETMNIIEYKGEDRRR